MATVVSTIRRRSATHETRPSGSVIGAAQCSTVECQMPRATPSSSGPSSEPSLRLNNSGLSPTGSSAAMTQLGVRA